MANIDIDARKLTPQYAANQNRLVTLRTYLRLSWRVYRRLSGEDKIQWRAGDPLLDGMLQYAERLTQGKDDG